MVQVAVLLAGIAILAVSMVFATIGKSEKVEEVRIFDRASANIGGSYAAMECRFPFAVRTDSEAILDVKRNAGRFLISVKEMPVPIDSLAGVDWILPTIYTEVSDETNRRELDLRPGSYVVTLTNDHGGDSNAQVTLLLRSKIEVHPKLYDVGIQMLVVAVPLIVAGLLS